MTPSISNLLFSLSSHSAASWLPSQSIPQRSTLQQDLVVACAELNSGQRLLEIGPIAILLAKLFNKQACGDDYDDDEIWESIYDVCSSYNTPTALPSPPITPLLSIVAPTLGYSLPPPPVYFYRVFDNLTHCSFTFLHGFVCGDPIWPSIPRPFHFDVSLLLSHLDWRSRVPSRYISVYDCPQRASWEAEHRLALGHRQNIWVATIDAGALFASGASCMSTAQAMETLGITEKHSKYLKAEEWFVFGQIPRETVVQLDAAMVFSVRRLSRPPPFSSSFSEHISESLGADE